MKKSLIILSSIFAVLLIVIFVLFILEGAFMNKTYTEPWDKNYHKKFDDPRTQIIAHGILAANGHNMQNWKFKYDPNNDKAFDMYIETDRLVNEVDPYKTQAVITQGTLFEYMNLASESLGYSLNLELFPDGEYSNDISVENLNQKRVARVELKESQKRQPSLYNEMFKPDTSRVAYEKGVLSQEDVEKLKNLNNQDELQIYYLGEGEKYDQIKNYVLESAKIETGVERVMQEAAIIFRKNEREKNEYRYGFSFEGSGVHGFKMHLLQTLLTIFPNMNNLEAAKSNFMTQTELATKENSGFLLITANNNSRAQQFNTGRLYSKIQLTAHTLGLAIQPLSQAIQEYPEMKDIYQNIHNDIVEGNETILMLFRIGKPVSEVPKSMRQDVEKFIEK